MLLAIGMVLLALFRQENGDQLAKEMLLQLATLWEGVQSVSAKSWLHVLQERVSRIALVCGMRDRLMSLRSGQSNETSKRSEYEGAVKVYIEMRLGTP